MNNNETNSVAESGQAIQKVLQAERDAERAIQDCEIEARQIIRDAHDRAQRINANIDQRITNIEMRHSYKLDKAIKHIEREGAVELRLDASQQYDADSLRSVVEAIAIELCQADSAAGDELEGT
jgi:vacuolar-type H+-ATPase subunit H